MKKIFWFISVLSLLLLSAHDHAQANEDTDCSICLESLTNQNQPLHHMTICQHTFHANCIKPWIKSKKTCPLCRADLIEDFVAACGTNNAAAVDHYLQAKFPVDTTNSDGYTPLENAGWQGQLDIIEKLLVSIEKTTRSLRWKEIDRSNALQFAAQNNHLSAIQLLLRKGANPNECDEFHATPLMWAAWHGNIKMMQALLAAGAKVNATDNDKWTALMYATYKGKIRAINLLLKHDANLSKKDANKQTALNIAQRLRRRHTECFLMQRRAV